MNTVEVEDRTDLISSSLGAVSEIILGLADLSDSEALNGIVRTTEVALDLPIELEVRYGDDGVLLIDIAPPTQQVETSVMPVFHRLMIQVGIEDAVQ